MKYLIFIISFLLILSACKKDEAPEPTPIPVEPPSVYVPIYQPGDTSMGAAYAKKLTANWKATSSCRVQSYFDTNFVAMGFYTFNNFGEQRESMFFSFIPRFDGAAQYSLKDNTLSEVPPGYVSPSYAVWTSDGDVLQDAYVVDSTALDNHFTVKSIDLVNKHIECTFTVTFKIIEPRTNPANPKTVKFSNGRAWAYIRD
jgi:hypothetical protein